MPSRAPILLLLLFLLAAPAPPAPAGDPADRTGTPRRRPNILVAISDDQSWRHTSAAGCRSVRTPAFDRVAREGVRFTQAFCASPGCSPSRAALLTGRYPWQLEQAGTHASSFPAKLAVYPDLLEASGYHVGYTGKGWGPGNWRAGGRTRNPAGPEYNTRRLTPPARGIGATDYAGNFDRFLEARPAGKPFCFWFGAGEPHLPYDRGLGLRSGKRLEDAEVPPFLPDAEPVRGDLLDYSAEIEWFDRHLGRILQRLEALGELDDTLVLVTSDNGMPFPRAKANLYDYGIHLPLAVRWPARVPGGRVVEDLVSFVDFAPTFLEAAGVHAVSPMSGRSLMSLLTSRRSGRVDRSRAEVLAGRERHSSARYENRGYPARAIRTREHLYIRNFRPERWPAGDPRAAEGGENAGFFDIDDSPTKQFLLENRSHPEHGRFFRLATEKRPAEELYDVVRDPGCLKNLAAEERHAETRKRLRRRLEEQLTRTGDPRMGPNGEVWESYPRYSPIRRFPPPVSGE